jgi:hypothetical protein
MSSTVFSFPTSAFVPIAVGFFGLGTGYLIYGPQELFKFPDRGRKVDLATGIWGIWMPGFMQFFTGVYLFAGLAWFHTFTAHPLYMAALAFTAYGVHWWAIGMSRAMGGDPRPNAGMTVAFTMISALGIVVFFKASDWPVGLLFIGLTAIYVSDFFASVMVRAHPAITGGATGTIASSPPEQVLERTHLGDLGERALGFFHLATGLWLMYLTWATALNLAAGFNLPL